MKRSDKPDDVSIDALYGLEPVIEPGGSGPAGPTEFVAVQCPYCGERFETQVDLSAGSFSYVEDCQVCCQPIELEGEVGDAGMLVVLRAGRSG
jgi:hypothetical protein